MLGCTPATTDPPPDNETGGTGDDGAEIEDTVIYDGHGKGGIHAPRLRDFPGLVGPDTPPGAVPGASEAIVIGAPHDEFEGVSSAGQLSILLDNGSGHVLPQNRPQVIVEGQHSPSCGDGQEFAWEISANRRLGSAIAFFTRNSGGPYYNYEGQIAASVATATNGSGRVLLYPGCASCAIFPKPQSEETILGSQFGSSVGVGFFGAMRPWSSP
jgi:hypothetical protein